ncbi:AEC family transporter [Vogesella oryzae]|uniref:AEC family transporter n=1 Tax=Vogesella oryzae TaxID=1735285 RepID=UPI001584153F|nr:AEC family transporter [Vogesella oryzae]
MSSIINVVLPIFGLILAGYLCRRSGRLGETASTELNRFVVWLALPALLFKVTATSSWGELWQPGFIASVCAGSFLVFAVTVIYRRRQLRHLADASIDGLSAAYANTGFLGIPLCMLVLGSKGLLPAIIATLIVACLLFAIGIVLIEIGLQDKQKALPAILKISKSLASNPLLIAPLLGSAYAASGGSLPAAATQFLSMLGAAATPCALVSLGLFLAQKQQGRRDGTAGLVMAKLLLQPLLTGFLAFRVFQLPALWADAALLLSALPTGTGPFMLTSFYEREAALVSRVILLTTLGSVITISASLYLLGL